MKAKRIAGIIIALIVGQGLIAETLDTPIQASRVIDLTQPLYNGMPYWPGTEEIKIERLADYDQGYRMHKFTMWENIGTHVDSPSHFAVGKGKRTIDQLPLNKLVLPILVIDVRKKVLKNHDYELRASDIEQWEDANGEITAGTLVVMNTGWAVKFPHPQAYINQDEEGILHFPGFSPESAKLLLKRKVAGIGIDTMSLDPGNDLSFPVHTLMLAANKFQIENMNNLSALPSRGAIAVIGVLPVRGGSQAQARIFALLK